MAFLRADSMQPSLPVIIQAAIGSIVSLLMVLISIQIWTMDMNLRGPQKELVEMYKHDREHAFDLRNHMITVEEKTTWIGEAVDKLNNFASLPHKDPQGCITNSRFGSRSYHVVRSSGPEGREEFDGPCDLCMMSDKEVVAMLLSAANASEFCNRDMLFVDGTWMETSQFEEKYSKRGQVKCAVFCFDHQVACRFSRCLFPAFLRTGSSDHLVARQILVERQMDFLSPWTENNLMSILDAGANIGLASALFASLYPNALIVAIEPSAGNYEMILKNTWRFPNVHALHSALWPKVTKLSLIENHDPEVVFQDWAFSVQESRNLHTGAVVVEEMQSVSIPFLIEVFNLKGFDFLKIDIEGGEKELLTPQKGYDMSFLKHARLAVVELHERFVHGVNDLAMKTFSEQNGWNSFYFQEHVIWHRDFKFSNFN